MVLLGLVGIEEFGFEWLWIALFFLGAFTLGFQTRILSSQID
jgi:membrane-bound ClpP family serine protease